MTTPPLNDVMLTDQVALVTGGGGGIGAGIARKLAQFGADIVIADIVPERCEAIAGEIRALGRRVLAIPTDCTDTEALQATINRADAEFGRIDILVNNVGGVNGRPFLQQSERSWRRHIDINLVSMMAAIHATAPIMIREGRGGSIINIASIEGQRAAPYFSVYAACKAGMLSFTRSMAVELSAHRIRVNAISPDHTVTPGMRGNISGPVDESVWHQPSASEQAAMNQLIPAGREGHVDECGNTAVFLASAMSTYITGVNINVDGGTWASSGWVRDDQQRWTLNQGLVFVDQPIS